MEMFSIEVVGSDLNLGEVFGEVFGIVNGGSSMSLSIICNLPRKSMKGISARNTNGG